MWSLREVRYLVLAIVVAVSGCGFHPLYGRQDNAAISDSLSRLEISPIKDRLGQEVRNSLLDSLTPSGLQGSPLYRLDVTVTESISSLAVKKSADATRADLTLYANYQLTDLKYGATLISYSSQATSSFNILNSEFATLMGENSARSRAIQQLSEDIRLRIAVAMKNHLANTAGK